MRVAEHELGNANLSWTHESNLCTFPEAFTDLGSKFHTLTVFSHEGVHLRTPRRGTRTAPRACRHGIAYADSLTPFPVGARLLQGGPNRHFRTERDRRFIRGKTHMSRALLLIVRPNHGPDSGVVQRPAATSAPRRRISASTETSNSSFEASASLCSPATTSVLSLIHI